MFTVEKLIFYVFYTHLYVRIQSRSSLLIKEKENTQETIILRNNSDVVQTKQMYTGTSTWHIHLYAVHSPSEELRN